MGETDPAPARIIKRVITVAGVASSALALLKLAEQGFNVELVPALAQIADAWERLTSIPASYVEPFITNLLALLSSWTGWSLDLQSHWKHIFFLMMLIVLRDATVYAKIRLWEMAFVTTALGLVMAASVSIAAGTVRLDSKELGPVLLISLIPITAFSLYHLVERIMAASFFREKEANALDLPVPTWAAEVRKEAAWSLIFILVGVTAAALVFPVELMARLGAKVRDGEAGLWLRESDSPGLLILGLFVILFAALITCTGFMEARGIRKAGESFGHALWRSGGYSWGMSILATLVGLVLFLAINTVLALPTA